MRLVASLGLAVLLAGSGPARAEPPAEFTLQGQVVSVYDGDTLTLRGASGARFSIRLSDIDTPERAQGMHSPAGRADRPGQAYADEAGDLLRSLALDRPAEARCFEIERRGGRPVCHVMVGGQPLHRALLQAGLAWAAEKPEWRRDPQTAVLQAQAHAVRKGLWADPDPVPPWDWRRQCWGRGACAGALTAADPGREQDPGPDRGQRP